MLRLGGHGGPALRLGGHSVAAFGPALELGGHWTVACGVGCPALSMGGGVGCPALRLGGHSIALKAGQTRLGKQGAEMSLRLRSGAEPGVNMLIKAHRCFQTCGFKNAFVKMSAAWSAVDI